MPRRLSIRAKLTATFATAMFLVLVAAAAFVYTQVRSDLNETLDENLQSRADDVASVAFTGGQGPLNLEAQRLVEGEDAFALILGTSGGDAGSVTPADRRVLASSLPGPTGPVLTSQEAERASTKPIFFQERKVPGVAGEARILARPVTAGDRVVIVVVGATTQDRDETLAGLRRLFLIGAPIALLLASGLGFLLAGRALAPVEAMRHRASEITLDRSGERLPLPRADDEIHRLGQTLNAMLDRIEATLERERIFVADASHELRTPLANLRTELELADRPGRSEDEIRAALRSAVDEVMRLSQLAEDLLVIARSDQGRLPIKREPTDLAVLLERVRERFARRAEEAGRQIAVEAPSGAVMDIDPLRIEQAVGNLLDNAMRHGSGDIGVTAQVDADRVLIEVSDHGAGFPAAFRERAFERFSRADEGRSGGGSGLGLAIVGAIAQAHDGGAEIDSTAATPTVRISLPL
jgi:two-component system OmpR family sensor kinase